MFKIHICNRCGHQWVSRLSYDPIKCAGCSNPFWNVPRKYRPRGMRAKIKERKLNDDKRIYGFHDLEVGQSQKWTFAEHTADYISKRVRALTAFETRTGRKFTWDEHQYTITRIK